MSGVDWAVLLGGAAAIAWVNWYFLVAGRGRFAAATDSAAGQEVTITVKGGYSPQAVLATKGKPLRLVFDRQERSGCSEEVVFPDFGVRKFLPPFEKTTVEVTPNVAGTFEFTCGMGMLRGRLVVQ